MGEGGGSLMDTALLILGSDYSTNDGWLRKRLYDQQEFLLVAQEVIRPTKKRQNMTLVTQGVIRPTKNC